MHTFRSVSATTLRRYAWVVSLLLLGLIALPASASAAPGSQLPSGFVIKPMTGTVRVLVMGCYFSDTDIPSALDEATVGIKRMYGPKDQTPTITQYFDRVSNGKLQLQTDVKGWYKLPNSFSSYANNIITLAGGDTSAQDTDCRQNAQQFSPDNYGVVVMLFNADTGMSNHYDGTSGKYIALRPSGGHGGWTKQATHVHEIGHALGLPHSHTVEESDSTNPNHAYSNGYDAMSGFDDSSQNFFFWNASGWCNGYADGPNLNNTDFGPADPAFAWMAGKIRCIYEATDGPKHVAVHYSAYQKVRLGWLSAAADNTAAFFGGAATISLQALGSHQYTQKQMIAIPLDSNRFYAVEYRKRDADYYEGGLPEDAFVVYLVDATQHTNLGDGTLVKILHVGETFSGLNGVQISPTSTSDPDMSQVAVSGQIPAPDLSSITPNYAASSRNSNTGWLPVTVTGTNFVPWSYAQWPATTRLSGQQATGSGFVDPSTLTIRLDDSLLRTGQSSFISVVNYLNGGTNDVVQTSPPQPFFVSPSGAATTKFASTTLATAGTVTTVAGDVTATATGTGSLAVAMFDSNPGANSDFPSADRWYTVLGSPNNSFGPIEIQHCDVNGGTLVRWWNGTAWAPVQPAATAANGCRTFTATGTSTPSVVDVQSGILLAVGRAFQLSGVVAPPQVDEGTPLSVTGSITTPSTDRMGLNVDWGDGGKDSVSLDPNTTSFSLPHRYLNNPKGSPVGAYPVKIGLTDSHGAVASTAARSIKVANVAPQPSISTDVQTEAPGNPVTAYIHIADKGYAGMDGDTFTAAVDWGDGIVDTQAVDKGQSAFAIKHVYADNPPAGTVKLNVTVAVTDSDGATGTASTPVTITFGVAATRILMCDDFYYGGRCRIMREKELPVLASVGAFNDTFSSISITGPAVVSVYENNNYQGRCETFTASDPRLDDNFIGNDSISSVRIGVRCP